MDLGLAGKTAVVAGSTSGIGFAIAKELLREGANVGICGRDRDRLAEARRKLEAVAGADRLLARMLDFEDRGAAERWIDETAAHFGVLHIGVLSSNGPPFGTALDFDLKAYEDAFARTTLPLFHMALTLVPHLRRAGWGRLLLIASETIHSPVNRLALSGIARIGVVRFAQSLAAELGGDDITVNVLAPGLTRTPLLKRFGLRVGGSEEGMEEVLAELGHHTCLGRLASPEEIAALATFLVSERASYVTGTIQLADGGASLGRDAMAVLSTPPAAGSG